MSSFFALLLLLLSNAAHAVVDVSTSINPINVLTNQSTTLNLLLLNSATVVATGLAFTDTLPAGMVVQSVTSNSCGGTLTAAAGSTTIVMSGGSIPKTVAAATGQCAIVVQVKATAAGTLTNTIGAGAVTTSQGSNPLPSSATLTVAAPVAMTASKNFSTKFIHGGGTSVTTIVLTNPNAQSLSGVAFTDTFPAGLVFAATPAMSNTCGGSVTATAGVGLVSLSGGTIVGGGSCTITFTVATATPNAVQNSTVTNTIAAGTITSLEGSSSAADISDTLKVQTGGILTKGFSPSSILSNGVATSTLTLTLQNRKLAALTGVSFTDNFPTGLTVAGTPAVSNGCGGTLTATAGAGSISLSGGSVPAATNSNNATGSCAITVDVVATTGTTGTLTNSMSGTFGDSATGPTSYTAASADLSTTAPKVSVLSKSFSAATEAPGGTSTLVITLANEFGAAANITGFTDSLATMGTGFTVAASPAATTTCGGTVSASGTSITMNSGAIPAATVSTTPGTCTITVPVQLAASGLTAGNKTNTIAAGALVTNKGSNASATTGTLTVALPTVSKAFSPTSAAVGPNSTLTITLTNPSSSAAAITSFSDNLNTMGGAPGGFQIASAASTTCGGTLTATVSTTLISLAGGTIPANASCTITVPIKVLAGTPVGTYTNTVASGALITSRGTSSGTSTAKLDVISVAVSKAFSPSTQAAGLSSMLTITLTNPSSVATTVTGLADDFLATMGPGFTVAPSPAAVSTCVGNNLSATSGATAISMSAGTIPANGNCTIKVPVFINDAVAAGTYTNRIPIGALTTAAGANSLAAAATLTVIVPSVSKVFVPSTAGPGPNSTLTITLTNPSSDPALISAFTDDLGTMGAGLFSVAASPAASSTCAGHNLSAAAGATVISMTAGTIPALGTCTITVPIQISTSVLNNISYTNTIAVGALKTNQGNNTVAATASLGTVTPTFAKSFSLASVVQGQPTTLTISLYNTSNITAATITSFTDDLTTMDGLGGFVIASSPAATSTCLGNNLSAPSGGTLITMTSGTIPGWGTCYITVPVVPLATISTGSKTNTLQIGAFQTSQGNNKQAASASVTVNPAFTCGQAYSPASVGAAQLSTLKITLTHANNAPAFTGLSFADTLPAGQTVASTPNVVSTCGGTVTAVAGTNSVSLSNGSLPTGTSSCSVSVDVKAPAALGAKTNTLAAPTAAGGYTCSSSPTATLTVSAATATNVILNKAFLPAAINGGGVSQMQLLIDNTAIGSVPLSGVTLTDSFPTGMVLAANANPVLISGPCTATSLSSTPGTASFTLTGATIPASSSCTWGVNVTSYLEGNLTNTIAAGSMTSSQSSTNSNAPTATLTVLRNVGVSKYFSPSTIPVNGTSTLNLTIFNTNAVARHNGTFTDTFPAGMTVAAGTQSNTCGGTLTATVGAGALSLAGATFAQNSICTLSVPVKVSAVGSYSNTIAANSVTTTEGSTNPDPTSATLVALNTPTITKAFGASSIASGGNTSLTFTLSNTNASALTGATFSDNLVNMSIFTPGAATGTCAGVSTNLFSFGQTALNFSGLTIPAAGSCTVVVQVTSSTVGVNPNTTSGVTSTETAVAGSVSNTANLTVLAPPTITKSFNRAVIGAGETSTMTIVVSNPNASAMALASTAAYTDIFPVTPGQMVVDTPKVSSSVCSTGGSNSTLRNSANGSLSVDDIGIQVNGGTIAAGGTCTITVNVTANAAGVYTNTTSTVATTSAGTSTGVGTATLTVLAQPTISKAFAPAAIALNGTSLLTFTLTNPNASTALTGAGFTDTLVNMRIASAGAAGGTCTGASANSFSASATALNFSGLSLPAGTSCTVTVTVTSSVAGSNPNTSSGVTTSQTQGAGPVSNTATLSVAISPNIAKSFSPSTISAGAASTLTITLTNTNPSAAINLASPAFTDVFPVSPGQMSIINPLSASTTCAGATLVNTGGSAIAAGNIGIQLNGGTIAAGSSCTVTVSVTASTPGTYNNTTSVLSSVNGGSSASGGSSTLTVNAAGVSVSGQLYADTNHSMTRDASESWSAGATAYVKLFANCSAPAVAVQTLNAPSGTYAFTGVAAGSYCIVVSNNASTGSTASAAPAGWLNMAPSTGQLTVNVGAADLVNQDFGLYNGSKLSGRVFVDSGVGGGMAADVVQNGSEPGLAGATLTASSTGCGGTCDSAISNAQGDYVLWLPAASTSVTVAKTNPPNYLSSGGTAGTTGGSYTLASDSVTFTQSAGSLYSGVNFADMQPSQFLTDGAQSAMPGAVVFYPHTFTAGMGGTVSFSLSAAAAPSSSAFQWTEVIYRDSNCNGAIDAGDSQLSGSVSLTAGQTLCLLVKEFVPLGAPQGALNKVTITANFVSGSVTSSLSHFDVTTVGQAPDMPLVKSVDKATALPGSTLTYTLTFTNVSSGLLSNVVVNDATPSFTVFVSASCGTLPLNLTGCTITAPAVGGTGNVSFTYTGKLAPNASGAASYTVQIEQ